MLPEVSADHRRPRLLARCAVYCSIDQPCPFASKELSSVVARVPTGHLRPAHERWSQNRHEIWALRRESIAEANNRSTHSSKARIRFLGRLWIKALAAAIRLDWISDALCLGLFVGSGVIEAGCKTVLVQLKPSGMFWTVRGANTIIALRCCQLSGRFEDYC